MAIDEETTRDPKGTKAMYDAMIAQIEGVKEQDRIASLCGMVRRTLDVIISGTTYEIDSALRRAAQAEEVAYAATQRAIRAEALVASPIARQVSGQTAARPAALSWMVPRATATLSPGRAVPKAATGKGVKKTRNRRTKAQMALARAQMVQGNGSDTNYQPEMHAHPEGHIEHIETTEQG